MNPTLSQLLVVVLVPMLFVSCATPQSKSDNKVKAHFVASQIVDLGALITDDLPQSITGKAFMRQMGFGRQNSFEVIKWSFPVEGGRVTGSNAYYTLFNHGGPHVDAPNHMDWGPGLDAYPISAFCGPVKVFDVSAYPAGRSVPIDVFRGKVSRGDVVLIFTRYAPPQTSDAMPEAKTLTSEAAEFLATLPIRAFGTDSFSVESLSHTSMPWIHYSFLSRNIPIYECLFNVDRLLGKANMFFVGVPLNIKDGDGMMVRPVVFIQ